VCFVGKSKLQFKDFSIKIQTFTQVCFFVGKSKLQFENFLIKMQILSIKVNKAWTEILKCKFVSKWLFHRLQFKDFSIKIQTFTQVCFFVEKSKLQFENFLIKMQILSIKVNSAWTEIPKCKSVSKWLKNYITEREKEHYTIFVHAYFMWGLRLGLGTGNKLN